MKWVVCFRFLTEMLRAGRGNLGRDRGRRAGHAHERRSVGDGRDGHGLRLLGPRAKARALFDEGGRRRLAARFSVGESQHPVARRQQHHAERAGGHHHAEARRPQSERDDVCEARLGLRSRLPK